MAFSYQVVGRNIRKARLCLHLTQEETAELFGMSTQHYGRIERGEHPVSLEQMDRISKLLDVSLEALLIGASDSMTSPYLTKKKDFGLIFEFLALGCSDHARSLMLEVCQLIAKRDKYSSP